MKRQLAEAFHRVAGTSQVATAPDLDRLAEEIAEQKMLAATNLIWQIPGRGVLPSIQDAEFQVFSQFRDDGIIQYLVNHLQIEPRTFIEFGVENYVESNTRFLLMNNQWTGLVIDGSQDHISYIQRDPIYWRHRLTAVQSFITAENINSLFVANGFAGEVGILSIDLDGVDYWIWNAIDTVNPVVVITEYNAAFGPDHAVTVPYNPSFVRAEAHYSNIYWGASLNAFCHLADKKGYAFIGTTSAGQNAYFVRRDRLGPLKELTSREGYTDASFRDSRDKLGQLTFLSGEARLKQISDMPVVDVRQGKTVLVGDLKS